MLAEFANYRSWIEWVPYVALLAVPFALRRIPPLSFALAGSFVGMVFVMLAPPLGRDAEQFGPSLAIGLIGGALAGALIGLLVRAVRTAPAPDASSIVLGWAVVLGVLGAVIGGFLPSLSGEPPDFSIETLFSTAIGGGLGWIVGTTTGWRRAREASMPDALQRSLLVVVAIAIVAMGGMIVVTILGRQFGPFIDGLTRHERHQLSLAGLYAVDTAIAVLTVLVFAARGSRATGTVPAALPAS